MPAARAIAGNGGTPKDIAPSGLDVWLLLEVAHASHQFLALGPTDANTINSEIDTPCELQGGVRHLQKLHQKVDKRL